ncbi:MAG: phosphatidylglycerophosphatase A [Halobacteriovoraceae bacterium]|nr:phosphatidylglycerophosphatase A [Halobacteriovoraceae bacterium]
MNNLQISLKKLEILFLSFFGIGFMPKAPGTWGTLPAVPIVWAVHHFEVPIIFLIPFFVITFIGSIYIINYTQKTYNVSDASWIVIDEVLGFLFLTPFIKGNNLWHLLLAFILFRIFDAAKIFPVNWFDTNVKGGLGVMLDDLVAAICSLVSYKVIIFGLTLVGF